ncbi:MAG TPA: sulfite oxidase [Gemmataceae bacterium]|nr:sulfite oxidase [Gemmataceae bacterium]
MDPTKHEPAFRPALDRRAFLGGAALGVLPLLQPCAAGSGPAAESAKNDRPFPGVITRQKNPDNVEFPFPTLNSFLTPTEQFYVRTHFEVPALEARTWRLKVEGEVRRPLEISYDELRRMPSRTVTALLECSGNSRVLLKPPQVGLRWEQGAVGTAEWTGVPLAAVLERAGVKEGAVEVILEGADQGEFREPIAKTPGKIHYARSLPLKKALQPEVLLAYQMNGQDLPPAHGFPVRAVVAGWYGMASVKWLTRLLVSDRPFHGYFQTFQYTIWQRLPGGLPDLVPVTELEVKAQIARPALREVVPARSKYRMFGAAWTGEADVTRVEVSTDGGKTWAEAKLLDKPVRYAWRFWEYEWATPSRPGPVIVMARATDSRGRVQPMERDEDRRDAMISHVQPIEVLVH